AQKSGNMNGYKLENLGSSSSNCNYTNKPPTMQISPPTNTNNSAEERVINHRNLIISFNLLIIYMCREEIQRIKENSPNISHREVFSTAAQILLSS
ncbi:Axial regulator YABBY 5, partial [Bienertia sinuspersici]